MSNPYTIDFFRCLLNQTFIIDFDGSNALLELVQVDELNDQPELNAARQPFSLLFNGKKDLFLNQQTYSVKHDALGEMQLFLVPVGENDDGLQYEAIFN